MCGARDLEGRKSGGEGEGIGKKRRRKGSNIERNERDKGIVEDVIEGGRRNIRKEREEGRYCPPAKNRRDSYLRQPRIQAEKIRMNFG
jgi:hypothetical protein